MTGSLETVTLFTRRSLQKHGAHAKGLSLLRGCPRQLLELILSFLCLLEKARKNHHPPPKKKGIFFYPWFSFPLFFWNSLLFFLFFKDFLAFLSVFPFFPWDFRGPQRIENPCFLGGFPRRLPKKKRGMEDQGFISTKARESVERCEKHSKKQGNPRRGKKQGILKKCKFWSFCRSDLLARMLWTFCPPTIWANSLEFSGNRLKLSADKMYRACELKDQTYKKPRTLHFSEIRKKARKGRTG